jgi:hypothetical protein
MTRWISKALFLAAVAEPSLWRERRSCFKSPSVKLEPPAFFLFAATAAVDALGVSTAFADSCPSADPQQIVVCGSREKSRRYPMPELPKGDEPSLRSQ